jgi:hypothetical protein
MSRALRFASVVAAIATVLSAAPVFAADVPDQLQGMWAVNGACDKLSKTIEIIGNTLAMGTGAPAVVSYERGDSPRGYDAIHFTDEGDVSNFEYISDQGELAYHAEGYGMGRTVVYDQCGD